MRKTVPKKRKEIFPSKKKSEENDNIVGTALDSADAGGIVKIFISNQQRPITLDAVGRIIKGELVCADEDGKIKSLKK